MHHLLSIWSISSSEFKDKWLWRMMWYAQVKKAMSLEEDVGLDRSAASSRVCAFVYAAVDFYKTSLSLPQRAPRQEEKVLQHFIPLFFFLCYFCLNTLTPMPDRWTRLLKWLARNATSCDITLLSTRTNVISRILSEVDKMQRAKDEERKLPLWRTCAF